MCGIVYMCGFFFAVGNSDYVPLNRSQIEEFNDDIRRRCFDVTILEDVAFEDIEQFQVFLSRSSGDVRVTPDNAVVRIIDTDRESLITFAPMIFNPNYKFFALDKF